MDMSLVSQLDSRSQKLIFSWELFISSTWFLITTLRHSEYHNSKHNLTQLVNTKTYRPKIMEWKLMNEIFFFFFLLLCLVFYKSSVNPQGVNYCHQSVLRWHKKPWLTHGWHSPPSISINIPYLGNKKNTHT